MLADEANIDELEQADEREEASHLNLRVLDHLKRHIESFFEIKNYKDLLAHSITCCLRPGCGSGSGWLRQPLQNRWVG